MALFDLHGTAATWKQTTSLHAYHYYEPIQSTSPTGVLIRNLSGESPANQDRLMIELTEAACTEVLIIDERIQKKAASKKPPIQLPELDFIDQMGLRKVYIPKPSEIDLLNEAGNQEKLLDWVRSHLRNRSIDFFVIHLGTIEKIVGTESSGIEQFINDEIRAHNLRTEIVITTGRGKPREVAGNTLFVHYSNIARFVIEEPSKFHLCKILFSARTRLT